MYTVYMLWCEATEMLYVGMTKLSLDKRWREHVDRALAGSQTRLHAEMRELGQLSFERFALHVCETEREARELEAKWIAYTDASHQSLGYNERLTDETREAVTARAVKRAKSARWAAMSPAERKQFLSDCGRAGAAGLRASLEKQKRGSAAQPSSPQPTA